MFKLAKSQNPKASNKHGVFFGFIIVFLILPIYSHAQCAMCRAAIETEGNTQKAEALNNGVVYLMAIPYLLVVIMAFIIYKMYRSKKS